MKRRHNRQQVIDFCHKLRSLRPEVAYGADIIAGFPTETDDMFENTRKLISESGIQYLHVFPYSSRAGTPAARMPQIPLKIRKERAAILRAEGDKELTKFYQQNLNREIVLLVENNNIAHSENFIPVHLKENYGSGRLLQARLINYNDKYMEAEIYAE